jgi:hypothetical protein
LFITSSARCSDSASLALAALMSIRFKNRGEEFHHQKLKHGTTTWKSEVQEEFDVNFRLLYALNRAYDLFLLNKAMRIQFCVNYVPPSLFKPPKRND